MLITFPVIEYLNWYSVYIHIPARVYINIQCIYAILFAETDLTSSFDFNIYPLFMHTKHTLYLCNNVTEYPDGTASIQMFLMI